MPSLSLFRTVLPTALTLLALTGAALPAGAQAQLGANLIVNGDAEAGPGSPNADDTLVDIPGWIRTGKFQVVQYGASGGFADANSPGPTSRGKNYFVGGPDNPASSATQTIDVSTLAPQIAKGTVEFTLSGYLGGYGSQHDYSTVEAIFENKNGKLLRGIKLGPVTAEQRKSVTGMLPRSAMGKVPPTTQKIVVVIKTVRTDGAYNDGSADNLSLVFHK